MPCEQEQQGAGADGPLTAPPRLPPSPPRSTFVSLSMLCGAWAASHPGAAPWWREWAVAASSCSLLLSPMRWATLTGSELVLYLRMEIASAWG